MRPKTSAVIILGLREHDGEIQRVKALGFKSILLSTHIDMQQALEADLPVEIDLNDEDRVLVRCQQFSAKYDIKGVYTLNEYRIPLGAKIAASLGISHHITVEAALNCRHKDRTRRVLAEHGVGSAQFRAVRTREEVLSALPDFDFPVIVKPSNDAGSHLVVKCENQREVLDAFNAITQQNSNWVGQELSGVVLIEEFLDGPEYSIEAYSTQNKHTLLAVTEKHVTPPPLSVEVGHLVPAPLPEGDVQAMHELVREALTALGVKHSVTHTEVKLTSKGPRIIEVNARPGGDRITVLVRAVTGMDLREIALHLAVGNSSCCFPKHESLASSAAIRFLTSDGEGTVTVPDEGVLACLFEKRISVKTGDRVEATTSNYNRLGHVIALGSENKNAWQVLNDTLQAFPIKVQSEVLA